MNSRRATSGTCRRLITAWSIRRQHRKSPALAAETLEAAQRRTHLPATLVDEDRRARRFPATVERPPHWRWSYEVIDTKLARHAKAKFVLQLAFYGELLAKAQGVAPHAMHVVLGSFEEVSFRCDDYSRYFRRLLHRFRSSLHRAPEATYPNPCEHCAVCHWSERCEENAQPTTASPSPTCA
jgi:predicted RecB family nuclease